MATWYPVSKRFLANVIDVGDLVRTQSETSNRIILRPWLVTKLLKYSTLVIYTSSNIKSTSAILKFQKLKCLQALDT
jgi:hypothetical protein